ncbi:GerAB/ArcD/ProY family transporter [Paenibacillus qinlingensis]|uniref:GerAB/ArcD/ProY family transporter n=1 Tax=Paenibacillus qinlingensis TaxID=1837343 RepID=UPI0015634DC2|nr:endospore germination permease [Paenibacillus qinlingensis]NQX60054.1 endospore germination permease [Paenibacillus qinlingensis]
MDPTFVQISSRQFMVLVIFYTMGSAIVLMPGVISHGADQDAWIAALIGMIAGIVPIWIYLSLGGRFPGLTIVEYNELLLGKWLGKTVSLLFLAFYLLFSAILLREIGDFVSTQTLTETPIMVIHAMFMIMIVTAARLGIETLGRAGEVMFPFVMVLLLIFFGFLLPEIKVQNIQPIMATEAKPIIESAILFVVDPFLELSVFLMIFPYVKTKKWKKSFIWGALIGSVVLTSMILFSILVLGAYITVIQLYPSYALARYIRFGGFIQRIEEVVSGIWYISMFFKLTLTFCASTLLIKQTFQLRESKFLVFPLAVVIVPLAQIVSPNRSYSLDFAEESWTLFTATFALVIPVVLLLLASWRKVRLRRKASH